MKQSQLSRYLFSQTWLGSRFMLWSLFWINLLGTIYGYYWYGNQLIHTATELSPLYLPFVPDSPTASLFFTFFIVYLLLDQRQSQAKHTAIEQVTAQPKNDMLRSVIEVFALITSFKYGIWAVAMIWAAAYQGTAVQPTDWMLTLSHLGMAAEVLLYWSFYRFRWPSVMLVSLWTLWNDYMDYGVGVFPWLPKTLWDDLSSVAVFTILLSTAGIAIAVYNWFVREKRISEV